MFGYLFFGKATESVITKNLNPGALADSLRITLSISLFFTYAIQLFPGNHLLHVPAFNCFNFHLDDGAVVTELLDTVFWGRSGESSSPVVVPGAGPAEAKIEAEQLLSDDAPSDGTASAAVSAAARRKRCRRIIGQSALRVLLVALTCFVGVVFENFGLVIYPLYAS